MKFLPERRTITAYGDGGFRFGDHSHRGSILIIPSGIYAWDEQSIAQLVEERGEIDYIVLGIGAPHPSPEGGRWREATDGGFSARSEQTILAARPPSALSGTVPFRGKGDLLKAQFRQANLSFESMSTSAAVRTYNIMFDEERRVAAAFFAVL